MILILNKNNTKGVFLKGYLENNFRNTQLEKARIRDPWELITQPTILPKPVSPKKLMNILIGLSLGIGAGITASIILEKKKDTIFSSEQVDSLLNIPLLEDLQIKNKENLEESIYLLAKGVGANLKSICFLSADKMDKGIFEIISPLLEKAFGVENYKLTDNKLGQEESDLAKVLRNSTAVKLINDEKIFESDILIENGVISKIDKSINISHPNTKVIDAEGNYIMPGIIDDQVHFREPGLTHKANIFSESRAAVAGGITSYFEMPNTIPNTTTVELLQNKFKIAEENSIANYSFMFGGTYANINEIYIIKKFTSIFYFFDHSGPSQSQSCLILFTKYTISE